MFIDSSALVAIFLSEPEMPDLRLKLGQGPNYTSAMVFYESALAVMRVNQKSFDAVSSEMKRLIHVLQIEFVSIDEQHAVIAVEAFARFGKGRHPAKLNMGDCFSYACAKLLDVPLLFKGNDFSQTDIRIA